jgi:NAD(P)-dependent dehydrogenase (short-subunit alcohol dehydrogenase family)
VIQTIKAQTPPIDILVNNAGTIMRDDAISYVHGEIITVDGGWMGR